MKIDVNVGISNAFHRFNDTVYSNKNTIEVLKIENDPNESYSNDPRFKYIYIADVFNNYDQYPALKEITIILKKTRINDTQISFLPNIAKLSIVKSTKFIFENDNELTSEPLKQYL